MNKIFRFIFFSIFFIFPQYSFAQQTNTQLLALIQSLLPTNGSNEISAADLRTVLANMVNSTNVTNTACLTASLTNYQWFADNAVPANVLIQLYDGTQCVTVGILNTVSHTFSVANSNQIIVGTTIISGGTNSQCLYNNLGVVGTQTCATNPVSNYPLTSIFGGL